MLAGSERQLSRCVRSVSQKRFDWREPLNKSDLVQQSIYVRPMSERLCERTNTQSGHSLMEAKFLSSARRAVSWSTEFD